MKVWKATALLGAVSMLALGCGKKDKNDSGSKPAPQVEVIKQQPQYGEGYAIIKANSNIDNAKFKCQVVQTEAASGSMNEGEWMDCDPKAGFQIQTQEGLSYIVNVKAINGSKESEVKSFYLSGNGQGQTSGDMQAQILNKNDVGSVYNRQTLVLNLGVAGMQESAQNVQFECKRESEREFRACSQTYDFGDLEDGKSYSLAIRGDLNGTKTAEDFINFSVELANLYIQGEEDLKSRTSGMVTLQISGDLNDNNLSCSIDGQPLECSQGYLNVNLSDANQRGGHLLMVELQDQVGQTVVSRSIPYCVQECPGQNGSFNEPAVTTAPIGRFWEMDIPDSMHITELSNAANYSGAVNYFQVMPESDAFYLGNDLCRTARVNNQHLPTELPFSMTFEGGESYNYCRRTVREDTLHFLTENRMGVNHLELATNASAMGGFYGHERIVVNEFSDRFNFGDFSVEWNFTRSRFHELCSYSRVVTTPIKVKVAHMYWKNEYKAYVMSCITPLVGVQMGGIPLPQSRDWQIGGLLIVKDELPWGCFGPGYHQQTCGAYSNKSVLEITYMTDRIQSDYGFVKTIQNRLLKDTGLRELMP